MIGAVFFPVYWMIFRFADFQFFTVGGNLKPKHAIILPIDGRFLVLQEVFNVHHH